MVGDKRIWLELVAKWGERPVAVGVAGTMMYGHKIVAKTHRVTILQPLGWYKGMHAF